MLLVDPFGLSTGGEGDPKTPDRGTTLYYEDQYTVDMSKAPAKSKTNELGWPRNSSYFWKEFSKTNPHTLIAANLSRIAKGRSPKVDETWIKNMPKHSSAVMGEVIEHHHINGGRYATSLPKSLHRGAEYMKINHPRHYASKVFTKGKAFINTAGKTLMVGNVVLLMLDMKAAYSDEPDSWNNTQYSDFSTPISFEYGKLHYSIPHDCYFVLTKLTEKYKYYIDVFDMGCPITLTGEYAIGYTWDTYSGASFDSTTGKWIGVGYKGSLYYDAGGISTNVHPSYIRCRHFIAKNGGG